MLSFRTHGRIGSGGKGQRHDLPESIGEVQQPGLAHYVHKNGHSRRKVG